MKEEFNSIYKRLYNENKTYLERLRKKNAKEIKTLEIIIVICCIVFLFLSSILEDTVFLWVLLCAGFVLQVYLSIKSDNKKTDTRRFADEFKDRIIRPLITNTFEGAEYYPDKGWNKEKYENMGFECITQTYSSEDLILAPVELKQNEITKMEFAEVNAGGSDKTLEYIGKIIDFYGLVAKMKINKDIGTKIGIKRNGTVDKKNKLKTDSKEFDDRFDLEAENQLMAFRIITSDIMAKMLEIREKYDYMFEINIIHDTIYMRVHTGQVFETNLLEDALEYTKIKKHFDVIEMLMELSKQIYKIIDEIEI